MPSSLDQLQHEEKKEEGTGWEVKLRTAELLVTPRSVQKNACSAFLEAFKDLALLEILKDSMVSSSPVPRTLDQEEL